MLYMSKKMQTEKNIKLTNKLIQFLIKGKNIPDIPQDVSFVPFSSTDKELNRINEKLLKDIYNKDKPVVKAEESKNNKGDWNLIPVNF